MKSIQKITIVAAIVLFTTGSLFAQNYSRSNEIIINNGEKYYQHTVKKGETIHSIAILYDVTETQITSLNQIALLGLYLGQDLKIPFDKSKASKLPNKFIYHKVKKKQTAYALSQKYDIDLEEIYKYNPQARKGLKTGEVLKIPTYNQPAESELIIVEDDRFYYHRVKSKETLHSIARQYNTTTEMLKHHNPAIRDKLQIGENLKIPKSDPKGFVVNQKDTYKDDKINEISKDPLFDINPNAPCHHFNYDSLSQPFKVAIMLPLFLEMNKRIGLHSKEKPEDNTFYRTTTKFLELYEGYLMAADSLRKKGFSIDLHVFDTKQDTNAVKRIIKEEDFSSFDLIIGPIYNSNLEIVADYAKQNELNIVSPLAINNHLIKENPFVFQAKPSPRKRIEHLAAYIAKFYKDKILIVHNATKEEADIISIIRSHANQSLVDSGISEQMQFEEIDYKRGGFGAIKRKLSRDEVNKIIIVSDNEVFVSNVIGKLNAITKYYDMMLFGRQAWEDFESMDIRYLHNLQTNLYSIRYIDYNDQNVKNFVAKYRNIFKTEPTNLSFTGFDVMYYFLNILWKYGSEFQFCLPVYQKYDDVGLNSRFFFTRVNNFGGFENSGVYIIHFDKEFNVNSVVIE